MTDVFGIQRSVCKGFSLEKENGTSLIDSSSHVTGVRSMLLSVSEKDSNCYVNNGVDTMNTVKGIGNVIFQLESRVSLKVAGVITVKVLGVSLLFVLALEDEEYEVRSEMEQCSYGQ